MNYCSAFAALILLGCSSGGSDTVPVNATGLWRGEWKDNGVPSRGHPMWLDIGQLQTGQIVGTSTIHEMGCMPILAGIDNGHVDDIARSITGSIVAQDASMFEWGSFTGTVSGNGLRIVGTITVGNTTPGNVCCCTDVPFTVTKQPPALRPRQSRRLLVFDGAQLVGEIEERLRPRADEPEVSRP